MDKISSGVYKILSGAGARGRALNLRSVVHGAVQNGSFDRYRFDRT
nr:hypothetical protein [uncultured Campylobacter sp.]